MCLVFFDIPVLSISEIERELAQKVRSNCKTMPFGSNVNQDFVSAKTISHLKCFNKHIQV